MITMLITPKTLANNLARAAISCCCVAIALALQLLFVAPAFADEQLAAGAPEESSEVSVLFVGNSFTYSGGYGVTVSLDALAKANGKKLVINRLTYSGASLAGSAFPSSDLQVRYDAFQAKLESRKWDYVVLQEKSTYPVTNPVDMQCAVDALAKRVAAEQPEAEVLLYMTHGFNNGKALLFNGKSSVLAASRMQAYVQGCYNAIGDKLGLRVVPAGMYFQKCMSNGLSDGMIKSDNRHPTNKGYFVLACAFYEALFGQAPECAITPTSDLSEEDQLNIFSLLGATTSIAPRYAALAVGQQVALEHSGQGEEFAFTSMDPDIAKMDAEGVVTAVAEGTTAIVLESADGERDACYVTVESEELLRDKILFADDDAVVNPGASTIVMPMVSGSLGGYSLIWESSDESVATVEASGLVTGVDGGSALITATDTVSGLSASYTVNVKLKAPTGLSVVRKVVKSGGKSVAALKVSWNPVNGAKKYRVYRATGSSGSFKLIGVTKSTSYADTDAKKNKISRYRVMAATGNIIFRSEASSVKKGIKLGKPSVRLVRKPKAVKVKWSRNGSAAGYVVYRAAKGQSGFQAVKTIASKNKTSWKDKSVVRGVKYRYKVRSYRTLGGVRFFSSYSKVRAGKAK